MPAAHFRYVPNPRMFDELARAPEMRDLLLDKAQQGANFARGFAPEYSGPTYKPGVSRHGEYKDSIYSGAHLNPNGWRAEFGANAPWSLQVEFGSGRPSTSRLRPQGGHSPKARPLGRALDSLRGTA
ncbi:hypothetical protein [Streptomyces sp. NPDC048392]|uniref:hypothetical protein n=1 Tax=Streptomyces sp. NPDC048392 TaxID=3365543 RepID=UPI003712FDD8